MRQIRLFLILFITLFLISCGNPAPTPPQHTLITTTDILADLVSQVAGEEYKVFSLVKEGNNPHNYIPTPQDLVTIAQAEIIFAFGGGLEDGWINKLILNSGTHGDYIELSPILLPENFLEDDKNPNDRPDEHNHHDAEDPHVWMDPILMISLIKAVAGALSENDPANTAFYQQNAENYIGELQALDTWIRAETDRVPPENRRLVTTHEFLGRYAERYGYVIVGTVLPANPHGEPSAAEMARLITAIRAQHVTVLFAEETLSNQTVETIGRETGERVVTNLLAGTLGSTGSYLAFMRHNTRIIVTALVPEP